MQAWWPAASRMSPWAAGAWVAARCAARDTRQGTELIGHGPECAGVVDRCVDLGSVADDARVVHQAHPTCVVELGDNTWIEAREGLSECLVLAQDREPREAPRRGQ